jgi:oligosaccharyltransferase complex subunit beta
VPQRLGVFRFVVDYTRYGLSFLDEQSEVSIIQWRHDAYPRYLTRAYPFYLSVMVLIGAFFIFIVGFLFSEFKSEVKGGSQIKPQVKKDKSE